MIKPRTEVLLKTDNEEWIGQYIANLVNKAREKQLYSNIDKVYAPLNPKDCESLWDSEQSFLNEFQTWLQEKIFVTNVSKSKVVFVDYDHGNERLKGRKHESLDERDDSDKKNAILLRTYFYLIFQESESKPDLLVQEYFGPELKQEARSSPIIRLLPRLKNSLRGRETKERMFGQYFLQKYCRQGNVPIVIADIANRPAYMLQREAKIDSSVLGLILLGLIAILYSDYQRLGQEIPDILNWLAPMALFLSANIFEALEYRLSRRYAIGAYNEEKIGPIERHLLMKYHLSYEDMRRVKMAMGVLGLAKNLEQEDENSKEDTAPKTITFPLPRAHILRVKKYLEDAENKNRPPANLMKRWAYALPPFLPRKVRIYKANPGNPWKLADQIPY